MKDRRLSQVSSSEDSDEAQQRENVSKSNLKNSHYSGESPESSDSERKLERSPFSAKLEKPQKTTQVKGDLLRQFTSENPSLEKCESDVVINEDDQICFLEVPKLLDVEQFLDKTINFDRRTKLKINKVRYVVEPSEESVKPITLLTRKLQIIHPVARLQIREYTKHKEEDIKVGAVNVTPALPENLKVRHPLFGAEYQEKIILNEEIEKKLDNYIDVFKKKSKKKHKEKRVKEEVQYETEQEGKPENETIFSLLESHSPGKKKKKKHKSEVVTDIEEIEAEENQDTQKRNNIINSTIIPGLQLPSFEFDMSGIGDMSEKEKKRKRKSSKTFIDETLMEEDEEEHWKHESSSKKKKKRERQDESEYETEKEIDLSKPSSSKIEKVKKKIKTEINSELQLPSFEFNTNELTDIFNDESHKKKKEKKNRTLDDNEDEMRKESSSKKKKIKNEFNDNVPNTEEANFINESLGMSKKKKEKSFNESEYETDSGHRRKIKKEPNTDFQLPSFDFGSPRNQQTSININGEVEYQATDEKKKKKHKEESEYETERETSSRKRKKSHTDTSLVDDTDGGRGSKKRAKHESESEDSSPKKKRKKEREEPDTNSLIMDILSRVKNEMDSCSKSKKKDKSNR